MNLSGNLDSVDLTTLERVRDRIDYGINVDAGPDGDAHIERLISSISRRMTVYLGFHTLKAERTETYELPVTKKVLTLSGRPIDLTATFELRIGSDPQDTELDTLTVEDGENYRVSAPGGWVRILRTSAWYDDALMRYARVTYTGGLATDVTGIIANFEDLAEAAELQLVNTLQRRDSLAGDIVVPGGVQSGGGAATRISREFGLLRYVREILDGYRRYRI